MLGRGDVRSVVYLYEHDDDVDDGHHLDDGNDDDDLYDYRDQCDVHG
jgi:hypothetical protein